MKINTSSKYNSENFLKNKVFFDRSENKISNYEMGYILDVFKKSAFLKFKFPFFLKIESSIEVMGRYGEYDVYSFEYNKKKYVIKIDEDAREECLKKEKEFLNILNSKNLAPKPLVFEKGLNYSFLLTTFDMGFSLSKSDIKHNLVSISKHLSYMHEFQFDKEKDQTKDFLNYFLNLSNYEELLPEEEYEYISKDASFISHKPILEKIKTNLNVFLESYEPQKVSVCHTNIKQSNILFNNNMLRFLNFKHAYFTNPIFDIFFTTFQLKFGYQEKETFFKSYYDSLTIEKKSYEDFKKDLKEMEKTVFFLFLLKILTARIYEEALYQYTRPSKYILLIDFYESVRDLVEDYISEYINELDNIFYTY